MDHSSEARKNIASAERASGDHLDTFQAAQLNALQGIGYALLDVAAAIREQTESLKNEGVVHRTGWRADRA
jgi:hypothetical protein